MTALKNGILRAVLFITKSFSQGWVKTPTSGKILTYRMCAKKKMKKKLTNDFGRRTLIASVEAYSYTSASSTASTATSITSSASEWHGFWKKYYKKLFEGRKQDSEAKINRKARCRIGGKTSDFFRCKNGPLKETKLVKCAVKSIYKIFFLPRLLYLRQ